MFLFIVKKICTPIAVAVFSEKGLYVFGILGDALPVAVIAVDEDYEVGGGELHLSALVVAGGCSDASLCITIYWQPVDVYHAAPYAFIGFSFASYAECQCVANKLVGIEAANAVAVCDGGEIDEVNEGVALIEFLALQHAAYEGFGGRTIARRVFAAGFIDAAGGSDAGKFFQRLSGQLTTEFLTEGIYLVPQLLTIGAVGDLSFYTCPDKRRANVGYFFRYKYFH